MFVATHPDVFWVVEHALDHRPVVLHPNRIASQHDPLDDQTIWIRADNGAGSNKRVALRRRMSEKTGHLQLNLSSYLVGMTWMAPTAKCRTPVQRSAETAARNNVCLVLSRVLVDQHRGWCEGRWAKDTCDAESLCPFKETRR